MFGYTEIGWISTSSMLGGFLGNYLIRYVPKKFDLKKMIAYLTALYALVVVTHIFVDSLVLFLLIAFISGMVATFLVTGPSGHTLFPGALPEQIRGVAFGIAATAWRVGNAAGSVIMSTAWNIFGIHSVFYLCTTILILESLIIRLVPLKRD